MWTNSISERYTSFGYAEFYNPVKYGCKVTFPNVKGRVTGLKMSNLNFFGDNIAIKMYVGTKKGGNTSLMKINGKDFLESHSDGVPFTANFSSTGIDVDESNPLTIWFESNQDDNGNSNFNFSGSYSANYGRKNATITLTYVPTAEHDAGHNFDESSISVKDNVLTATCNSTDMDHNVLYGGANHKYTLTLDAEDGVFSYYSPMTAFSATLTPSLTDFNNNTQLNATCTFNYHNNDTGSDNTAPPKTVGNYTVTATIRINGTDYVINKDFQVVEGKMVNNEYHQFNVNPTGGVEGETITITFTPQMGESIETLTVTGDNTSLSLNNGITDNGDNTYTFTMPNENVTLGATFNFSMNDDNFAQDGDTYTIKNADGWNYFCQRMENDATLDGFNGKIVELADDITVSTMVGSAAHKFKGLFDGKGHTLTFNCTAAESNVAPFHITEGATIRNVHTMGLIEGGNYNYIGGLVGEAVGDLNIENCRVSTQISTTYSFNYNVGNGGFVGLVDDKATFKGCVFDGLIYNPNNYGQTYGCGGFVGNMLQYAQVDLTDCLFLQGQYDNNDGKCELLWGTNNDKNSTFLQRSNDYGYGMLTNCFYDETRGLKQGSPAVISTTKPANLGPETDYCFMKSYGHVLFFDGKYYKSKYGDLVETYDYRGAKNYRIEYDDKPIGIPDITSQITTTSLRYNRSFTENKAEIVMLPFNFTKEYITLAHSNQHPSGHFYSFAGIDGLTPVVDSANEVTSMKANTPYIYISGEDTEYWDISNHGYTISIFTEGYEGGDKTTTNGYWTLSGTYSGKTWTGNEAGFSNTFYLKDDGELARVEVGMKTLPTQGYFVSSIAPHAHNFTYSSTGDTITATCGVEDCPYHISPLTMKIVAPTLDYCGGTVDAEATVVGTIPGVTAPDVVYKKGETVLDAAPTTAGTYTASITISGQTASVTYTIAKERVTPTVTLSESSFTYDGTEKKPGVIVKIGNTPLAETDYTVSYSNNINAGENTASVLVKPAVAGNYIFDDKEINFSIAKADASITIGTSSYSKTYGDVAFTLADIATTPADATLTYTVSDSKNVTGTAVDNDKVITVDENGRVTIVGAGSAKITVALPESQNYNAAESKTIDVTVAKCADPAVVTTTATQQKGGKTLDLSKMVSGAKGAVSFALKEGHEGGCSLVGNTLTSGTGVGTAVVTVTIADSDNHNGRNTDEITVSIVDKETKTLTVTQEDVTYGGTAVNPSYTVASGATNKTISYTGTLKKDGSTYSSQTAPTEPGNYSVVVSYETDTEVYTGSTTFKINKATITVTGKNKNIYTGETVPNLTNLVSETDYTVTGLVSGETLIGTVALKYQKDGENAVPDNTKAGIYQIVPYGVTVPNADNYNDISFVNGTLTITVKQSGGGSSSGGSGGGTSSGGSSSSGGGSSSSGGTSTPDPNETSSANATTTEASTTTEAPATTETPATTEAPATTEVKPGDTNTETITNADGSTTVKETVKNDDGSVDQKETTTTTDGTKIEKEIITSADGTKIEKQSTTDSVGNKTTSTATTNKDGSKEKKVEIANVDGTTEKTVEDVKPDGTTFTTSDIKNSNGDTVHEEKTTKPSGDYTSIKETTSKTKHTILVEENVGSTKQTETYNVTGKKTVALTKAITNASSKAVTIPKTINSNGKTYKVTTLKKGMLKVNQSKPKTVKLSAAGITKVEKGAFNGMAKKGIIKISGTAKQVKKLKKMLKKSGLSKGVKIKRVK